MSATPFELRTTGQALVAFQSCGCWSAVQVVYADPEEQARESLRFIRDVKKHSVTRIETLEWEAWRSLLNGVNGDLKHGCDHDPQWGGDPSTHDDCPRCHKSVKLKKDGTLSAHKGYGYPNCTQEPWPQRVTA